MLRISAAVAAYLLGSCLVYLLARLSEEPAANTLEPLPLNDGRPR